MWRRAPAYIASKMVPRREVLDRVEELAAEYLARGRVVIDEVLDHDVAVGVSRSLQRLPFTRVENAPVANSRRVPPRFWHHHAIVEVDPRAVDTPVEDFVRSMTSGPLRDLVGAVTSRHALYNRLGRRDRPILVAHAYPRGGYLEEHDDVSTDDGSRRAVSLVWHASPRWDAAWGGVLRFTAPPEETTVPRFNALHLFAPGDANRHEVTMVTGREIRYTLGGWLYERAS